MNRRTPVVAFAALALVIVPAASAAAAAPFIGNGDFETDPAGSPSITSWTQMDELIDLGVTPIAGCVSQDTSDYSALRDYADNAEPVVGDPLVGADGQILDPSDSSEVWMSADGSRVATGTAGAYRVYYGYVASDVWGRTFTGYYIIADGGGIHDMWLSDGATGNDDLKNAFGNVRDGLYGVIPDPSVRQDTVPPQSDGDFWDDLEFSSAVVDQATMQADPDDLTLTSNALQLYSTMEAEGEGDSGYIAHGPAVYSEPFTTEGPREVSLDWFASGDEDDYHVLGYVLDVDTCQQYEVLDSTGELADWSTATLLLPDAGTYRFVFVSGTYDATWGSVAGALMYVDDIRITPVFAQPAVLLEPLFDTGDAVGGAQVQLSGSGLTPESPWTAQLTAPDGTATQLDSGTTSATGAFWRLGALPQSLAAGTYVLTVTGAAPTGAVTSTLWLTVNSAGVIDYSSSSTPDPRATVATPTEPTQPTAPTTAATASPATAATATAARAGSLAHTGGEAPSLTVPITAAALVGAGALLLVTTRRLRRR